MFYYVGAIRESNGKKVYFYPAFSNQERLLYDFSVNVGGTVMYVLGNSLTVTNIDFVLLLADELTGNLDAKTG